MFRKNVAAVIFNECGDFLACHRKDRKSWQCVQGGVEDEEDVVAAARREIFEEIGLNSKEHGIRFVGEIPPPDGDPAKLRYLLPKFAGAKIRAQGYIGQEQRLLLFYAPSSSTAFVQVVPVRDSGLKQEFCKVQWMNMSQFLTKVSEYKQHIFDVIARDGLPMVHSFLSKMFPMLNSHGLAGLILEFLSDRSAAEGAEEVDDTAASSRSQMQLICTFLNRKMRAPILSSL